MQYDIPGSTFTAGEHRHIIPMAALVNYKLDTGEEDFTVAVQSAMQDCMMHNLTILDRGQVRAVREEDSPVVIAGQSVQELHVDLDTHAQVLAATVPLVDSDDAHATIEDTFLANAAPAKITKMKTGVTQFKTGVTKLQGSRIKYVTKLAPHLEEHPVDTSVKAWDTLVQAIADDTDEFSAEQTAWFGHRFGRNIRFVTEKRLADARTGKA